MLNLQRILQQFFFLTVFVLTLQGARSPDKVAQLSLVQQLVEEGIFSDSRGNFAAKRSDGVPAIVDSADFSALPLLGVGEIAADEVADSSMVVPKSVGGAGGLSAAPAGEFYTDRQVETLKSFSSALFQTTRESLFPQFPTNGPINLRDNYFATSLAPGNPTRGCLLSLSMIQKELKHYFNVLGASDETIFSGSWDATQLSRDFVKALGSANAEDKGILASRFSTHRFVKKTILRAPGQAPQLVFYIGDIHGGVHSLLRNLLVLFEYGYLNDDFTLADNVHLVFLGDYTDRGLRGIETIYTILRLKNATWDRVHLVRGNHEDVGQTQRYGFATELQTKYGPDSGNSLHDACLNFYATLPVANFFGFYDDARAKMLFGLACHGCMSPYFDARAFLSNPALSCIVLSNDMVGEGVPDCIPFPQSQLFEWSDVTGDARYEKMHAKRCTAADFLPEGGRGLKLHYRDLGKILAINEVAFVVRGHQDNHAPVKVCCDGEEAPVSFRGHPLFQAAGITPYNLFHQGIRLADIPNCITTTTCVEAKLMPTEGLVWIMFGADVEHSGWGGLDVNLTNLSCAELSSLVLTRPVSAEATVSPIELPCMLSGQAVAEAVRTGMQSIDQKMNTWMQPGGAYAFLSTMWQSIVKRSYAFVSTGSFMAAQRGDNDLHTPASWHPAQSIMQEINVVPGHHFRGGVMAVDLGDLRASFGPTVVAIPVPVVAVPAVVAVPQEDVAVPDPGSNDMDLSD